MKYLEKNITIKTSKDMHDNYGASKAIVFACTHFSIFENISRTVLDQSKCHEKVLFNVVMFR